MKDQQESVQSILLLPTPDDTLIQKGKEQILFFPPKP